MPPLEYEVTILLTHKGTGEMTAAIVDLVMQYGRVRCTVRSDVNARGIDIASHHPDVTRFVSSVILAASGRSRQDLFVYAPGAGLESRS